MNPEDKRRFVRSLLVLVGRTTVVGIAINLGWFGATKMTDWSGYENFVLGGMLGLIALGLFTWALGGYKSEDEE